MPLCRTGSSRSNGSVEYWQSSQKFLSRYVTDSRSSSLSSDVHTSPALSVYCLALAYFQALFQEWREYGTILLWRSELYSIFMKQKSSGVAGFVDFGYIRSSQFRSRWNRVMPPPITAYDRQGFSKSRKIEIEKARFPYCLVWTPLPVVAWLAPFIGHVGICREDGIILDFAGPFFVNVDRFAFGSTARYVQLDTDKCCFPSHLSTHRCEDGFAHAELGTGISWNDALSMGTHNYQHKSYNLFTCNCHSFTASCMNRLAYNGSIRWNVVDVAILVFLKGQWVSFGSIARSFGPFLVVMFAGLIIAGWPFLLGWAAFSVLLLAWFVIATYCMSDVIHC